MSETDERDDFRMTPSRQAARRAIEELEELERALRDAVLTEVLARKDEHAKEQQYVLSYYEAEEAEEQWDGAKELHTFARQETETIVRRMIDVYRGATKALGLTDRGLPQDVAERAAMAQRAPSEQRKAAQALTTDPATLRRNLEENLDRMVREGKL